MNKKRLFTWLGVLALCIVLGGCNNPFGKGNASAGGTTGTGNGKPSIGGTTEAGSKKPPAGGSTGTGKVNPTDNGKNKPKTGNAHNFVPDDMKDSALSDLSPEQKAEIKTLYGSYWMDGVRDNCIEIGAEGLASYSTAMSFSYENVRWAKLSDSWVCSSYHSSDSDYESSDRKVILKFTKASGGITLWQYIVPMNRKAGPFKKGKAVEKMEKDGKTYYVYDKADSTSPKMLAPIPR